MKNNLKLQEQMHQMKLQFFTNISHEFRTPLTLILSPLQDLISGSVAPGNYPRLFNTMHKNTLRLLNLVNDLMDFRKAEMGGMKILTREVDINALISEACAQFEEHATKRNITFNINTSNRPLKVWIDDEKIKTVIFNLLSNAFKYTQTDGLISVTIHADDSNIFIPKNQSSFFETSPKRAQKYIAIEISDTGIGITKESMPQIFERFYQVDGENTHRHLGSGVGLALAKNLVLAHSGDIGLTSIRNEGTRFIVKLPLGISHLEPEQLALANKENIEPDKSDRYIEHTEVADTTDQQLSLSSPLTKEANILLVEDDDQLRNYLREKLNARFNVTTAVNGLDGIEKCKATMPDVIVTDLMMPILDGFDMTQSLKEDPLTCHIPVIMLTAKSSVEDNIKGASVGADIYLSKPVDVRLLDARIVGLMENRKRMLNKYSKNALFDVRELSIHENEKEFVVKLESIILERISDPEFDVNYICSSMNMGRTNLYQKVKTVTEMTLGDFVKNVRLKRAVEIMLSKDVSIAEVTYMVGMSSPSYFTKTFKKKFNKTPTEFLSECSRQQ